jgi:putative glycosyltransferase (TIGR04348 family)
MYAMRLLILTPAQPPATLGNAITAQRYARFFRSARWKVDVTRDYHGEDVDVLVALHARKSSRAALAFRHKHPDRPLIVVLTGTDLYHDLPDSAAARRALAAATAIVTLQPEGLRRIPLGLRGKARSIVQSAPLMHHAARGSRNGSRTLRMSVIGHMRSEKDPLRAAYAVRLLPKDVAARVIQAGGALEPRYAVAALLEMRRNQRYRWLGELSAPAARRLLCASDAMIISSNMEGGANVVCEAIACGVPIFASRIPGNTGILGRGYPGLFTVRSTAALARLMRRAYLDRRFLMRLGKWIDRLRPLVAPSRERREWIALICDVVAQRVSI